MFNDILLFTQTLNCTYPVCDSDSATLPKTSSAINVPELTDGQRSEAPVRMTASFYKKHITEIQ
ncbi:Uncharacterized protein dnm_016710 [Desulfonema magnum]|uniref:Uncharacterized protein n=1 Tax=Desulfonema magnum TaxID=45655 RepID=A0A975BHZ8_9BACT|nr:Uncharacterized protein dnm_016710 [Desulfonema magnum]